MQESSREAPRAASPEASSTGLQQTSLSETLRFELQESIESAWQQRDNLSGCSDARSSVKQVLSHLDTGTLRAAEKRDGEWITNEWVKKAILLSFRLNPMRIIKGAPDGGFWWDKIDSKFKDWKESDFRAASFRAVPSCIVRHGSYIARDVILMPSFVNIGAYVGEGTMIDTWSTVGSCAQIGSRVHISGGAGIGGVLEPLQARPVIIEDDCFIGARAEVAEGVLVEQGSVLAMGVFLGQSTRIIDRASGETYFGRVPAYSVVVPGSLPAKHSLPDGSPAPNLACAVIVKKVDAKTKAKTSITQLLRDANEHA